MDELSAKTVLFEALIDDASLFPPAERAMAAALRAHARNRESAYAFVQGTFVVPASRLGELEAQRDPSLPLRLSVIGDGSPAGDLAAIAAMADRQSVRVVAVERKASPLGFDAAPYAGLALWLEAPYDGGWAAAPRHTLAALAALRTAAPPDVRLGAKVRCGGLTANAVPSVADLAAFIAAAHEHGVPFKATAGLHHPIRRKLPETQFAMHGFLNLALATYALHAGKIDESRLVDVLAEEDARAFTIDARHASWRDVSLDAAELAAARAATFTSYGSCSFDEPVIDLVRAGIIA